MPELSQANLHVLMIFEGETTTSQLMESMLHACRPFNLTFSKALLTELTPSHFQRHTIPLFIRCGDPAVVPWVKMLSAFRHPCLYYIDDNFWELQGESELVQYYRQPSVRRSLELIVSHAHQVITNSDVLAAYLEQFSSRLRVLPPFFDFSLIEGCIREQTDELRIGFAGSPSRGDDLELIRPAIGPVLDRVPNAVFEFCGAMPADVEPTRRIRFFAHEPSYASFIRFQAERNWAIGLAPLRDNAAARAKTNNKYREYGACGIAGVYSAMPPYEGSVQPGVTGLLCGPSPEAWTATLLLLAESPSLREEISRHAQDEVRSRYSLDQVAQVWFECICQTQPERGRRHSGLAALWYLTNFHFSRAAADTRTNWQQVKDAHRKGGVRMVVTKTIERIGSLARPRPR
jgi:glycosyltransferase involved in cell wall biosynthesis